MKLEEINEFEKVVNDELQTIIEITKILPKDTMLCWEKDKVFNACLTIRLKLSLFIDDIREEKEK